MRLVLIALLSAFFIAEPIAAQAISAGAVPTPRPAPGAPAAKAPAPADASFMDSPYPTFDEGTVRRIAAAMLSYSALEVRGGWPTLPKSVGNLRPGSVSPDVARLRERLVIADDLGPEHLAGEVYDGNVEAALRRFQARHGLPETGAIGPQTYRALNIPVKARLRQLAASVDRLAGMDFLFGQRYVVVNIPAAVAEAVAGERVERRHIIVVGKPDRPSPTLTTQITAVNLNPTWTVPLGILKKDVMTRMRRDPGYVRRMRMRVLDGQGREIDPQSVDWSARAPNFTVRQDSGAFNALGAVRFDMPNPYAVFMHDTNKRNLFEADYRFHSSGCARVADVRDLAVWLLQDNPGWDRRRIDATIATGKRTDVRLTHKVPVAWVYLTGWATRDGVVHFRDDVYSHDQEATEVAGIERPAAVVAARASGFVLQSADPAPREIRQVSYMDSQ
jgi:murein L,D-transpeptidase YcbB/YkuD